MSDDKEGVRAAVSEGVAKALDGYRKHTTVELPQPIVITVVVTQSSSGFHPFAFVACIFVFLCPIGVLVFLGMDVEKHFAAIIGLALGGVAIALTFAVRDVTPLQRQMLLALFALAGGAIATEIPGFLNLDVTLGAKTAIGAGGAMAVFVLLYLFSARKPPD